MDNAEWAGNTENKKEKLSREIEGCVSLIFSLILTAGFLVGLSLVAWQIYGWLRFGVWNPLPISLIWATPDFSRITWVGLRQVVEPVWLWLLGIPLSVFIPASTLALLAAFLESTNNLIKRIFGIKLD